jgi:hypothetical protein
MLPENGTSSAGAVGELQARIDSRTDRSRLSIQPRLRSARYQDDASLDSDDQYLDTSFDFSSEKSSWTAAVGLTRDTTLTSEVDTTGIVQANRRHEGISLSGSPTFALTQRLSAGGQLYWLDNHYVDAAATGLVDYEYRAASLFTQFSWSELSLLTLTADAGELVVPSQDSNTRNATLRLGWRYQPAPLWTLEISAGPSVVEADSGSDNGSVFKLDLRRNAERWSFNTSAGRDLTPTGRGVLTRRDQVSFGASRKLTEFVSTGISIRGVRNQDLGAQRQVTFEEIEYGRIDVRVDWRVSQQWTVALGLAAATQSYESRPDSANNYRASLSIVWNGQPQLL